MGLFVSRLRVLLVERTGVEESLRDLLERSTVALEIGVVSPPAHDVWRELQSHAADWGHRLGRPDEAYRDDSSASDLLVMSAGIRLPPAWDHEMQAGLHSANCWGTLSPLCDAVPAFRIVEHADGVPGGDRPATVTRCLLRRAGRGVVETPLPLPSCVLIRGGRAAAKAAASGGGWAMIHEAIAEVELEGRVHGLCRHVAEILERRRIPLVAPTAQAGEHLRHALPHRGRLLVKVIEHGYAAVRPAQVERRRGEGPLRLVVLGSMSRHKGIELLQEAWPRLRGKVEIHFLGCGSDAADRLRGMGAASVVLKYAPEALEALVRDIAPDAGLLASVWPETFCYTLSELWFLGVPPLATRLGSFVERIRDGETGLLFEPHAEGLVTVIERLVKDRSTLDRIAGSLDAVPVRSIEQMIADYHALLQPPALLGVFCRGEGYPQRNEAEESLELDNPMVAGTGAVVVRHIGSARNLLLGRIATMAHLPAWRRWILRAIVRLWLDLPLQLLGLMHRLRGR